jgi:DNA polymerase-3 subunit alpha
MQPFAHLHVHSQYSLLDGQAAIRRLVDKAIDDGMKGMALTDHGVMYGIKEFINYVTKKNAPLNAEIKKLEKKIEEACKQNDPGQGKQTSKPTCGNQKQIVQTHHRLRVLCGTTQSFFTERQDRLERMASRRFGKKLHRL